MKNIIFVILILCVASAAYAAGTVVRFVPLTISGTAGVPMIGFNRPQYIDARVLAANVAEDHTVPTGAKYVLFSGTGDFYVKYSTTATIPAVDVTDGSGCELNPVLREITGVTTISLISASSCTVTMLFYK